MVRQSVVLNRGASNSRCKLPKLVSHHIFRDGYREIIPPIVNLKLQSNKVGQNRSRSGLRSNGRDLVVGALWPYNGEAIAC